MLVTWCPVFYVSCSLFLCQVNTFDSLSYGNLIGVSTSSKSRCSSAEPSTSCSGDSQDEVSLRVVTAASAIKAVIRDSGTGDEIRIAGLPISVESHMFTSIADPLRHRSKKTFVRMPPNKHCQLIQTPIDFHQPITVVISLSTKVDK